MATVLAVAWAVAGLSSYCPAHAGTKWALLVGIDNYESDDISSLKFSVADVKSVAGALISDAGFPQANVITMTSDTASGRERPTHVNVIKRLDSLATKIGADDTFLLYFSGHGYDREGGQHFLATVNADASSIETLSVTTIPLKLLQDKMSKIQAKHVIFMIDACRNDPEKGKGDADNLRTADFSRSLIVAAKSAGSGLAGSAVLFACSEGQRAYEWPEEGHGVFTYYLLEGLRGKASGASGDLTINDLADYVQKNVIAWGLDNNKKQVPDLKTDGAARIVLADHMSQPVPDTRPAVRIPNPESVDTKAHLHVAADPSDAKVYLDGVEQPDGDISVDLELEKTRVVEIGVKHDGYATKVERVTLARGLNEPLSVTLDPNSNKELESHASDAKTQFKLGLDLNSKKKYAEAEPYLREAVRLDPTNAEYQDFCGVSLDFQNKYAEAEVFYREALRLEPTNDVYQVNTANVLNNEKKYVEAEPFYREIVRRQPNVAVYRNSLGNALYHQAKYVDAEEFYRDAVRLEPKTAAYQNNLAGDLRHEEKYAEAEPFGREAVRLEPENAGYQNDIGAILDLENKYTEAEPFYREAIRLDPATAVYQENMGGILNRQKLFTEAEPFYREGARLKPENAEYQNRLGNNLTWEKQWEDAVQFLREAVRLDSTNAMYKDDLGSALANQDKKAEAESSYRGALDAEPTNARFQYHVGYILTEQKKYDEAAPYLREAIRIDPSNALYQDEMGTNLTWLDKWAQAEPFYREAVRLEPSNELYKKNLDNCLRMVTPAK